MVPTLLQLIYDSGEITDSNLQVRKFSDNVSLDEAKLLNRIVEETEAKTTLETGLAYGGSALAICGGKSTSAQNKHFGIDPNQTSVYGQAAVYNLTQAGYGNEFELLEGPSHIMIPKLIERGETLDFAFVDGWHTFDYTLIDFFMIDKMLKPGGYVAFHDMYAPSKQKVLRFILSHRKYSIAKKYLVRGNESKITTLKFFLWRMYKYPALIFSSYHWKFQFKNSSGLIVLQKNEQFEPDFDFYKSF
ncbi:MAG: class I SAM-dependent methyltransferase [Flavobacteriales bacterium]|nr:class I SAM-dependent methyltransferase [Flavobacteriales bacterium]